MWQGQQPEMPNPDEILRTMRSRRQAHREIVEAVRVRAAGKSREEIRQMLVDQYSSMNVLTPSEQVLSADVEIIARDGTPLEGARQVARVIMGIGAGLREISGLFKNAPTMQGPSGKDAYFVMPDRSQPMVEVALSIGADRLLEARGDSIPVALERMESSGSDSALVRVYFEAHHVGTISPNDGLRYKRALDAAQQRDQTLVVMGRVDHASDGTLRMRIYPAGTA